MLLVMEWVEAISKQECGLLKKAAFYDNQPTTKQFVSSTSRTNMPKKAVTTGCQTSKLMLHSQQGVMIAWDSQDQKSHENKRYHWPK